MGAGRGRTGLGKTGLDKRRAWVALVALALVGAIADGCSGASGVSGFGNDGGGSGPDSTLGDSIVADVPPPPETGLGGDATHPEGGLTDAMLAGDGLPDVAADGCVVGDAGPALYPQRCVTDTASECDGVDDQALMALGIPASMLNGMTGNGFDDDCDGKVDEGCACPGNGQTKDCYLVPASQIDPATHQPVGWCTANSKGSLDCAGVEFPKWSGVCRGAQPPYAHDVCAPGDFNCDGVPENSDIENCACQGAPVQCPTNPIVEAPYPDPTMIKLVDGTQWIVNAAQRPSATNWTWTVIGGDCDNVLPHPTYAIYNGTNSTTAMRIGARTPVVFNPNANPARYVAMAGAPLISMQQMNGNGVAGGQIYPAFGLSGDYIVQGEWDLAGKHYVCTQKVQVRAPGIRAELCWDNVGGLEAMNPAGIDMDLHFARLQGLTCPTQGWDQTCPEGQTYQDCYYSAPSGCRDFSNTGPLWGYADSANSACLGWSSKRQPGLIPCTNPRLDKDNIECDKTVDDPTNVNNFCGPENINLDNPNDGDSFAVMVNHYCNWVGSGTNNAHPHVNLYCDGQRVLSVGYNPLTGQTQYPVLGFNSLCDADTTSDYWEVGTISVAAGDAGAGSYNCTVQTVPSHHADQMRDGVTNPSSMGNQLCVESQTSNANPPFNFMSKEFVENIPLQGPGPAGVQPATIAQFCKH